MEKGVGVRRKGGEERADGEVKRERLCKGKESE